MILDKRQQHIVLAGTALFILMGLFPPWTYTGDTGHEKPAGYALIITPPEPPSVLGRVYRRFKDVKGVKLDWSRLIVQWLVVAAATGVAMFLLTGQPGSSGSAGDE